MKHKVGLDKSRKAGSFGETLDPETREVVIDMDALYRQERKHFAHLIGDFLACAPSIGELEKWAAKNPDRWGYTLRLLMQMAGFTDKIELSGNLMAAIGRMSDLELMKKVEEQEKLLGPPQNGGEAVPPEHINGTAKE